MKVSRCRLISCLNSSFSVCSKMCFKTVNISVYTWILSTLALVSRSINEGKLISPIRYSDEPFSPINKIHNRTVTCGNITQGKFVAPTFTCANIRVDGHKLAYGLYPGWSVGFQDRRCQDTQGIHEFGEICLSLLKGHNKEKLGLKAVYVPNSTCKHINETRMLLRKVAMDKFEWREFKPGYGYTDTIQCMTRLDRQSLPMLNLTKV